MARLGWITALVALAIAAPASAAPRVARANGNNMPRGFTWPPSQIMRDAAAACERGLDEAGVHWTKAGGEGHLVDAVTIDDATLGGIVYAPAHGKPDQKPLGKVDCQLALALARLGPTLASAGVREVRYGSIYRWSLIRVGGKTRNALSRHALGLAMDVAAFVDTEGREAVVSRDYQHGDPLLHAIEQAIDASSAFRTVLTPQNDPASHHDHFHIEANPSYSAPPPRS
ncbi:MAG TPA: extensin family protein [Kofleriaceae bacterium]